MNRLKKIISFVLCFSICLLFNVSYAEWNSTPSKFWSSKNITMINDFGGYTLAQIAGFYGSSDIDAYNNMVASVSDAGYYFVYMPYGNYSSDLMTLVFPKDSSVDIGANLYGNNQFLMGAYLDVGATLYYRIGTTNYPEQCTVSGCLFKTNGSSLTLDTFNTNVSSNKYYYGNFPYIKKLIYANASYSYTWDGTYLYEIPGKEEPDEPDTPSLPSNAEITQAVQAFYNSDYYKNNKDFEDFIVLYNTQNQYFDFIGHTLGNTLGQVILPPNYRYQGKLYNEQWWKFYIDENQGAIPYSTSYYLYSSNDFGENFTNNGIGKISELVGLDFSTKSVIVYSTTDYPVRTYVLNEETGDYTYTDGIIEGDQYTYDENLDPTISGYNPLDNFVTVDPSQTIIGDADFEGFSNSFEEHKDLFSFTENMQWLIVANNKLSNYFLGFIVMCALFLTLSRVLKG